MTRPHRPSGRRLALALALFGLGVLLTAAGLVLYL